MAPGLSANSSLTVSVADAMRIASAAEISKPAGGTRCESGLTSWGIGWPPKGDCSAGSSAVACAAGADAAPRATSAARTAMSRPIERGRHFISGPQ